jgi:uncharacterized protein YvpB
MRRLIIRLATLGSILAVLALGAACGTPQTPTDNKTDDSNSQIERKLDVPFVSQWAPQSQNGGANCGPASLTMALHFYGKTVTFKQVVAAVRAHTATGYTDFESSDSLALLQQNGLDLVRANGQILNMGSLADIKTQIDQNRPVIMLVDNHYGETVLYGAQPNMAVKAHIVVVTGYQLDESGNLKTVFINDPLAIMQSSSGSWVEDGREGFGKDFALTCTENESAFQNSSQGWYGAAVVQQTTVNAGINIQYGQTVSGNIAKSGDHEDWKFTGTAGDVITIRMSQDGGASLYPLVQLWDSTGTKVASDCSGSPESRIANYTLLFSGIYTIRASGNYSIGGYKLSLTKKPATPTIAYGDEVTGQIVFSGDYQDYKFQGTAGDVITIRMSQDGGASLYPLVQLWDSTGTKVASDCSGSPESRIANYTLLFSGIYTIRASGNYSIGGFKLALTSKPVRTIAYGDEITGQIVFSGDYQDYKFQGTAGDVITIRMSQDGGASLYPLVQLWDSTGTKVASACSGSPESRIANYTLLFSGTYTIRASGNYSIGGFKLSLVH